jgi:hypothetical protein
MGSRLRGGADMASFSSQDQTGQESWGSIIKNGSEGELLI